MTFHLTEQRIATVLVKLATTGLALRTSTGIADFVSSEAMPGAYELSQFPRSTYKLLVHKHDASCAGYNVCYFARHHDVTTRNSWSGQRNKGQTKWIPPRATSEDPPLSGQPLSSAPASILLEPIAARRPSNPDPSLINADLEPTLADQRTFDSWDIAALWIGLVVGVPTWYLAGSLVELGMCWWQGLLTVLCGNLLVLVPMVLNAHPGCKYGLPFPVLARASFGIRGAIIPSVLRGVVACGWFAIQTWIGASAIHDCLSKVFSALPWASLLASALTWLPASAQAVAQATCSPLVEAAVAAAAAFCLWLGASGGELLCFLGFWAAQVAIVWRGMDSIRTLESLSAPVLACLCLALLLWALSSARGLGPMLSAPSQFAPGAPQAGRFWRVFFPALTANVGFWATLCLNISDFTRFATSQADQVLGQALGLPLPMLLFSFLGLAVTSATVTIFGPPPISDPVVLLGKIPGIPPCLLSCFGICLATVTTNIAANIVAPANALLALSPTKLSFPVAATTAAVFAVFLQPWRLVSSPDGFLFAWLGGYSAFLGPVAGVLLADYFLVRKRELDVDDLYSCDAQGRYWYHKGYNLVAVAALAAGVLPNLPGLLQSLRIINGVPGIARALYDNSWLVGSVVSANVYSVLMGAQDRR